MNILVCYGTRPELIKIKPLLTALKENNIAFKTLRVEQHTTLISDKEQDDYTVSVPSGLNRLDALLGTANCISEDVFKDVTHLLVQGDTATAFMCAMAGFHRGIPVIHLEAGLRTYDSENPYPEETYRQMISRVASIHLCPTQQNMINIVNERNSNSKVFVVGNTVLDNLVELRNKVTKGDEVIVTLHRRENHPIMDQWFLSINKIAQLHPEYKFIIPLHPNPNVQKHRGLLTDVKIIDPMPYEEFITRLSGCAFAISDSGGIQEEVSFLGKSVVVCRKTTERPESVGLNSFLCDNPNRLIEIVETMILPKLNHFVQSDVYGDGKASEKIANIFKKI
jgi:UDP-N-acetylglucosamine 2-epimerase (non-hydrolysing)